MGKGQSDRVRNNRQCHLSNVKDIFLQNHFSKIIREMALVLNSYPIAAFEEIRDLREIVWMLYEYISLYLIAIIKLRDNACINKNYTEV